MSFSYHIFFEYLSFFFAVVFYRSLKKYSIGLLMPYLFAICVIETVAQNVGPWFGGKTSIPVINVYLLLHPFVYSVIFYRLLKPEAVYRKVYWVLSAGLLVLTVTEFFVVPAQTYHNYTNVTSLVLYLVANFIVLFRGAMNELRMEPLYNRPVFWLATGHIIFCLVAIMSSGLRSYFMEYKVKLFGDAVYRPLMYIAIAICYSCYAFAFYLCHRNTRNSAVQKMELT